MSESQVYLSVVVTARNDDHGGSLLNRMQAFVNGWIGQCQRHGLASELIVVDWNPPADRPPLINALQWPEDTRPCDVRFIQVPPEVHRTFRHGDNLPLYQMIAKNVGIRRARGQFVLVTNIDILFSDELVRFLIERRLQPGRMYRIDRHDVMSDVPAHGSVDDQLSYCASHLIRVNAREGTFALSPEGDRVPSEQDIARPNTGITFGSGWYAVESNSPGEVFRWVSNEAEMSVNAPPGNPPVVFDLEPGPGVRRQPFLLQIVDLDMEVVAQTWIHGRCKLELQLPIHAKRFFLRTLGGGNAIPEDPRILNFRVYSCSWAEPRHSQKLTQSSSPSSATAKPESDDGISAVNLPPHRADGPKQSAGEYVLSCTLSTASVRPRGFWRKFSRLIQDSGSGDPETPMTVTVPKWLRQSMHAYSVGGAVALARWSMRRWFRPKRLVSAVREGQDIFDHAANILPGCGWYNLENFAGETFRWAQNDAELVVRSPKEGPARLAMHIEPGPGVGWKPFELMIRSRGVEIGRCQIKKLQYLEIPLSLETGRTHILRFHLEDGDRRHASDPRTLNFRLFWCGWAKSLVSSGTAASESRPDIPRAAGLFLGEGWQPQTDDKKGECLFITENGGEIIVQGDQSAPRVLRLEVSPGTVGGSRLDVHDSSGNTVASGILQGRQICYLTLPIERGRTQTYQLRLQEGALRIYRLDWADALVDITDFAAGLRTASGWSALEFSDRDIFRTIQEEAELEIIVPAGDRRYLKLTVAATSAEPVSCLILNGSSSEVARFTASSTRKTIHAEVPWEPGQRMKFRIVAPHVRVYGCGWSALPGEPEIDSMRFACEGMLADGDDITGEGITLAGGWYGAECSADETFRWVSHQAEILIHANRSLQTLVLDVEPGPSMESESFVLQILDRSWRRVGEFMVSGRQEIRVELVQQTGTPNLYRLMVVGGGLPVVGDPRILDFRVYRVEVEQAGASGSPDLQWKARVRGARFRNRTGQSVLHATDAVGAVHLHTNACGDFTLMARDHWFDLRGYPEFDMYSFHIDSILCYAAHHGGAREEVLKEPLRIYHIEHGAGSGWTPEGQARLFDRLRANGISWIEYQELVTWAAQMRKLNSPMIFNRENWGLAEINLPEMLLPANQQTHATKLTSA